RQAETFGQHFGGKVADPVGAAEGAEFGEFPVVENEDELALFGDETLNGMAVTSREVPHVTGAEVVGLRSAVGGKDSGADLSLEDIAPFGRVGVPVEFAQPAGLESHQYAGNAPGDGQLSDRGFLGPAALEHPSFLLHEGYAKAGEGFLSFFGLGGIHRGRSYHEAACRAQHVPPRDSSHDRSPAGSQLSV